MIRDGPALVTRYPNCAAVANGTNTLQNGLQVAVQANFASSNVEELSAAMQASFPVGAWLGWLIHAVGVEVYLKLTPAENERLRRISHERQVSGTSPW
jgi:hypothetical protein